MSTAPAANVTPEQMARYRANARRRWADEAAALATRKQHARDVAQTAADFLRRKFGAQKIVNFGSLAHEQSQFMNRQCQT